MAEYNVTIGRDEYVELLNTDFQHGLLMDVIFNSARLSTYEKNKLVFDSYDLGDIVKLIAPHRYEKVYNALKEMEADET